MKANELPRRLKRDAIAEAICEVRFECDESRQLPEMVVYRLRDNPGWKHYSPVRLPLLDVPAGIRAQSDDWKYQPLMELHDPNRLRIAKIGSNVVSFHALAPYPGWDDTLSNELAEFIEFLFSNFPGFKSSRIGLRYVNLLTERDHQICDLSQLNYRFDVDGERLSVPQMLSYERPHGSGHLAMVRISSPKFVLGPVASAFSALVDVDVYSPAGFELAGPKELVAWLAKAHTIEKIEFFGLLTPKTISHLRED